MTAVPFDFRAPPAGRSEGAAHDWLTAACRLSSRGPLGLTMRLVRIDTILPADWLRTLPESALGFTLEIDGRMAFLTLGRPLLLALLAGRLGEQFAALPADRELTPVERDMLAYLIPQLLEPLRAGWPGPDAPPLKMTSVGAPRSTCRLPAAPALAATLNVSGAFGEEPLTFVLPPALIADPERPAASTAGPFDRSAVEVALREMPLDFSVELGRARLTLGRLSALKTGDVVLLDQRINDPLRAFVSGVEQFEVWPGAEGRAQAVRVHAARKATGPIRRDPH